MEGTPFGRYRLIDLLGAGGMGEVWRAYDTVMDRVVALKLLPSNLAGDRTFQQRFRREACAAAGLDEPHIVPIHDYGEIDGRLYVTMRLIHGRDLQTILTDGPLSAPRAVTIINQIAAALSAAHTIGLIHRDVKPSNFLVTDDDFAYLIDFGIARAAEDTVLTSTGSVIGTWAYMAPERLNTGHSDARADIYALTCVLYETLTGQRPYPGDSLEQQIVGHLSTPAPKPSTTQPALPTHFDTVIATGLAKDPNQRYPTAKALAHATQQALNTAAADAAAQIRIDQQPTQAAPIQPDHQHSTGPTPRSPWIRRLTAVSAAALFAVVVVLATRPFGFFGGGRDAALPFTGLVEPYGVSIGDDGTVYVADPGANQVVALLEGATHQTRLQVSGLARPHGVAVGHDRTVYVADTGNHRVLALEPNGGPQLELAFTGLHAPHGVATDHRGTVYVTDTGNKRVLSLAPGAADQSELPFTDLDAPQGIAVDDNGTVYVADTQNHRVVALASGADTQTVLPFSDLSYPEGVAVDARGTVLVSGAFDWVGALPPGGTHPARAYFTDSTFFVAHGIAVDTNDIRYVSRPWEDPGVVKLANR